MAAVSILHPNGIILLTAYQRGHKMAVTRRPQGGAVQVEGYYRDEKCVGDLFQITAVFIVVIQRTSATFGRGFTIN